MTLIIDRDAETTVEEVKNAVRGIASNSPDEVVAIAKINQLEGVNVSSSCANSTGSFTFFVKITLLGEKNKIVPITTRFRR